MDAVDILRDWLNSLDPRTAAYILQVIRTFTGSGSNCGTTADVVDTLTGGSTGWVGQSFTFQATAGTETLGFLGIGPTNNVPAFALVDNLSITQNPTPEPSSLMLLGTGLAGLGGLVRSRLTKRG